MKTNTLANTPKFTLTSWGNGLAYSLFNRAANQEVYVQGDDADQFITMWGNFNRTLETERACAEVWDVYADAANNLGE